MATLKQRKAAENIVENHGNVSKAMRDAGYDETTAKNPKNLTESKGFLDLCDELGLTDNFLLETLVHDIKELPPKERLGQLSLGAKMRGRLKDVVEGNIVTNLIRMPAKRAEDDNSLDA